MSHRLSRWLIAVALIHSLAVHVRADESFPVEGILPKAETGATRFLEKHPDYDGRGVVVAIFDTGVDPGAAGLQTTTDGKPKIVDMVDGSGSGDVDTSTIREADKRQEITGLTGRQLKLPLDWKNPTGKYHVGIKRAYELFPERLIPRLKQERKKEWDVRQRELLTKLQREVSGWDPSDSNLDANEKKIREELKARLSLLKGAQKKYDDPGPIYDGVVFHDGKRWQAVIDTDEDGDLGDEQLMTNFRAKRQFATFGSRDLLNFAVNIYEDGNLLSIVTDCGSHGTHVAGIVAGHYPDQPELSGIAPGAQIVSVKIGDRRLGSSSTGTGEVRGLIAVLQNKCDLINMSYGGPATDPNSGRIIQLYSEIVNKHGVIFVSSAGNNGPALTTVGSPGGTTSAIIGVGAYVTPAMMKAEYALRDTIPELPYTWTSRGPTQDGDLGVDICAPGGAIAPVPTWQLKPSAQKNGTSMSSPNACGGIALLLSGLKAEQIKYTPHSVRRALENTARKLETGDEFANGQGSLQVDAAFEHATQFSQAAGEQLRFEVDLPQQDNDRGVYLREKHEVNRILETLVRVRPTFHEDADNRDKVDFQIRLTLESTADWIDAPDHLLLVHGGDSFGIQVDPTQLEPGAHYAEVRGFDGNNRQRGPLFRLPITVIRPEPLESHISWSREIELEPGGLVRNFLEVPDGATWAELTLRAGDFDASRLFVVHAHQNLPKVSCRDSEFKQYIRLQPNSETVRSFAITGGRTLELCLAQYWSNLAKADVEVDLEFHGLVPSDRYLAVIGDQRAARVDVSAPLRDETIEPAASLKHVRRLIPPKKSEIRPLGERDLLPDGRQIHEMIVSYSFELKEPAEVQARVALSQQDESWRTWSSQLWIILDENKRVIATGSGSKKSKLPKGKFDMRWHVRHDEIAQLELWKNAVLSLEYPLAKPITLDAYADADDAVGGGKKFGSRTLRQGGRETVYFGIPRDFPDAARPGDLLTGTFTFGKSEPQLPGAGQRPDGFPIRLLVPPAAVAKTAPEDDSAKDDPKILKEQLRQTRLAHLASLREKKDRKQFDKLAAELLKEGPNDLDVLIEQVKFLDDKDRKPHLPQIVELADKIIAHINTNKLAAHYGVKLNPDDEAAAKTRKEMDRQRGMLTDALYRKGRALAYMDLPAKYSPPDSKPAKKFPADEQKRTELFEANFADLRKWVDVTEPEFVLLHIRRERRHGRAALALKALNMHIDRSPPSKLLFKKRGDIYDELGWEAWRDYERKWMLLRFPADYPRF